MRCAAGLQRSFFSSQRRIRIDAKIADCEFSSNAMPSAAESFRELWEATVAPTVEKIFNCERVDSAVYEKTQSAIYNHSISDVRIGSENHSGSYQLYRALGELYEAWTAEALREVTEKSEDDDAILASYSAKWTTFTEALPALNRLLRYVNRSYVKRYGSREREVYAQDQKALLAWKSALIGEAGKESSVVGAVFRLIERSRNGENVDANPVKSVVDSLVSFGFERSTDVDEFNLEEEERAEHRLRFYADCLEKPLIEKTLQFYRKEAAAILESHDVCAFMHEARRLLEKEKNLCARLVNVDLKNRVLGAVEEALICEHLREIQSEFLVLLKTERVADLKVLFDLSARVTMATDAIAKDFENHVKEVGLKAVESVAESAEPSAFISALLDVHKKFDSIVTNAFSNNPVFVRALDVACHEFVNDNAIATKFGSSAKCAEIVARHIDRLQRRGCARGESSLDDRFAEAMIVFKYLDDKDVFEKFYTRFLAARLAASLSASNDNENLMIARLQEASGYNYTAKMCRMLKDVVVSGDLAAKYRESADENHRCEFSVAVLSSGVWAFPPSPSFAIPQELTECVDSFAAFYSTRHQSRKLTWLMERSRGEILTTGFSRKYTLTTTALQAAILLQFSERDAHSEENLCRKLEVTSGMLLGAIAPITKMEILTKENDVFAVNPKFSSKKLKIDLARLQTTKNGDSKKEMMAIEDSVKERRRVEIQAAIVRILKMRRRIAHTQLLTEVIAQMKARFSPQVGVIKKCVDLLMEKDYLRRVEGERDLYEYIA